jgi:tRNA pseudouridine55 synthase
MEGLLLVDKPSGVTSHDVVQVLRRKLNLRRIGHTGTLDPMAQGLLVLLVGRTTSFQQAFQGHDKTYEATIRLGVQTDTADAAGQPIKTAAVPALDHAHLQEVLRSFEGPWLQQPPVFSAIKVRGRPAYWWARRRKPVTLAKRMVQLYEVSLVRTGDDGTVTLRVQCSAGTYVRTLAEAVAERLGTVAHLSHLVRLRVGRWHLADAKPLSWFMQAAPEAVALRLLPVESGAPSPHP